MSYLSELLAKYRNAPAPDIGLINAGVRDHNESAEAHVDIRTELSGKASFKNGTGTFPSGTTHTVTDAFITASTLVTIIPTAEKQGVWSVDSADGSFTITSDATETTGVTFDWGAVK